MGRPDRGAIVNWFVAPLIAVQDHPELAPEDVRLVPAADFGKGLVPYTPAGSRIHVPRETEGDCLICVPDTWTCPDDWVPKTVLEAQAHFTAAHHSNRAPTEAEVS